MKTKIAGVLVCLLLITISIPTVVSYKKIMAHTEVPSVSMNSMAAIWKEKQKLLAPDGVANDRFGYSVSISGDTALVGAPENDDNGVLSGSAYVFICNSSTWTQQAKLLTLDNGTDDRFGQSVSLSSDTALIGAYYDSDHGTRAGAVYVFTRNGTIWIQQAKLFASDAAPQDNFGFSVSIYGDTALIGANYDEDNGFNSGSAYIFTRNGTIWTQQAKILPSDGSAEDNFGYSVSLYGDTAFIGANQDDDNGFNSGSVYVFIRNDASWTQQSKLLASDGAAADSFGNSISLEDDTAIIGAMASDDKDFNSGSAYIFTRINNTWIQQAELLASDGIWGDYSGDYFGWSVSLSKDTALVSAYSDNTGKGSVYVFNRIGTAWIEQAKLYATDGAAVDWFGWSVSLNGDTAIIGAYGDDGDKGSAYAFIKENGTVDINITGGLGIKAVITNHGAEPCKYLSWELDANGGTLGHVNKIRNGLIDIPAGKSRTVRGLFFGFGPIIITLKVADEEKVVEGTQILFFTMVKK